MEYRFRNLPCRTEDGKARTWYVAGKMRLPNGVGSGILEWCDSEYDANLRMAMMNRDYQFCDLFVGEVKS